MRLDHVHLVVDDRPAMLEWLASVLGIVPAPGFDAWSDTPGGPVFTQTAEGGHAIAVFAPREGRSASQTGDHTIAFEVTADRFTEIADRAKALGLAPPPGMPASTIDPMDLGLAFSVFIEGPEGTRFEVTCYDLDTLRARGDAG